MKKVLVVYYSQSGQLKEIAQNLVADFPHEEFSIEWFQIGIENDYPFPWTSEAFYNAMPESVLSIPAKLKPLHFEQEKYDLIIFGYQPWFLSPSIPAISILSHPDFKRILNGTAIVTLIGARNMWVMAQKKIKALIKEAGGNLVGNIVLEDRNLNLLSAITIQYWMYTGKKETYLGIFPKPGISENDINATRKYGKTILDFLLKDDLTDLQAALIKSNAIKIHTNLLFIEGRAKFLFTIWAKIIIKRKNRTLWLKVFKYYLMIALFLLSPIVILAYCILYRPFFQKAIKRNNDYYLGVK